MLNFIQRALRARDAAERIMGYKIEAYNQKVSKILSDAIRESLKDDIAWLAKIKRSSTPEQFEYVRATTSVKIEARKKPDADEDTTRYTPHFLLTSEFSRSRNYYRRTDDERAQAFLDEPVGYAEFSSVGFAVPARALTSERPIDYDTQVPAAVRKKLAEIKATEGAAIIAEYAELVASIHTTLAACPNWSKLLVAWPDAAKWLPELEPAPKQKALIVPNEVLATAIKKHQPPKKIKEPA